MSHDDERLAELLDRWEDALDDGRELTAEELCADAPQLLEVFKQQIAALRAVDQRLKSRDNTRRVSEVPEHEDEFSELGSTSVAIHSEFVEPTFLAKGGLGAVYIARDGATNREVALKFIHPRLATDTESRLRFHQEAEVTALLEHPGIVPLYGIGETEGGRLFYAMRLVRGRTMESSIARFYEQYPLETIKLPTADQRLALRDLLRSFQAVCHTVAYAHNRGIVHRDLKPQNVMLGRFRETVVVDWGLATAVARSQKFKVSEEATLELPSGSGTSSNGGAGTPPYMSPSQISKLEPTPADDIYSLGVILYKILTGGLPFYADSTDAIRELVLKGKFDRPTQRNSRVSRALEAICLKAMAYHPAERYSTAIEIADDVERYMADEPVTAYSEPILGRVQRRLRRHRGAVIAGVTGMAAVAVVVTIAAGWLATMADREHKARVLADQLREQAEISRVASLTTSARLGARTVAQEIDRRWWILQSQANSAQLREMLTAINAAPRDEALRQPLQLWLTERYMERQQAVRSSSWFINSSDGTQVARCPRSSSIGQNFAHRSYFTGQPHDAALADVATTKPHEKPVHMSGVFQSTNTKTLMVAFSVPIWDRSPDEPQRQAIGILCMTTEVGFFELPASAMIVDTREDTLLQPPLRGLVLHHDRLGHRSRDELPPRIGLDILDRLETLQHERMTNASHADSLVPDFKDPVVPSRHATLAAIEPVIIAGRNPKNAGGLSTGWAVIVVDRQ